MAFKFNPLTGMLDVDTSGIVVPGGVDGAIQYKDGVLFAGASNVSIEDDNLRLAITTDPTPPSSGQSLVYAKTIANRAYLTHLGPSGLDVTLQPNIARNKVGLWNPPGNATTVPGVFGFTALSLTGTATARNVATTNILTRTRRIGYVSAAATGSLSGARVNVLQYTTGNGAGLGGFTWICRFGVSDAAVVAGARMFVGLRNVGSAPTNVEPNTYTNAIGIAQLSTDSTQWYLIHGGSAAQTEIPLGTSLGAPDLTNTIFELALFSPPTSNGIIHYQVTNLGSNVSVTGTLTPVTVGIETPSSTTLLTTSLWRSNNTTALAVSFDIASIYVETDY